MSRHPATRGVFLVFEKIPGEFLVTWPEEAEKSYLCLLTDHLENVYPVVVGEITKKDTELGRFEVVERFLDERVGEFRNQIRGKFRTDGFEQKIAFLVVKILVKMRKVRVVGVLGSSKQGGAIGRIQRPHKLTHGILVEFIRHARRLCPEQVAIKKNDC
jgi:hypothetical protein